MKTSALNTKSSTSLTKLEQRLHLSDFLLKLSNQMSAFGNLDDVLHAFVEIATRELNAERGTIFLNDPTTNELYSRVAQGHLRHEIRILNSSGIAGSVFTAQESLIILEPYDDPRFNQTIDEQTGFVTRSILCVPIRAGNGNVIGVAQLLNKHGGPFNAEDKSRLKAFSSEISIALQNAKLFADVQSMKNYNESMLESMSSGVLTLDETEQIVTCNAAGLRILQTTPAEIVQKPFSQVFYDANAWVLEKVKRVMDTGEADITVDAEIEVAAQTLSVNLTIVPLTGADHKRLALIPTTSSRKFTLSAVVCFSNTRLKVCGMASGAWKASKLSEHDRFSCSGFDTICRNRPSNLAVPAYGR